MNWAQKLRIRQLSVLIVLHESRNMTAAAVAVGMSQPALSKWLSELEAEIGAKLFVRTTRGFQATPVCDEFMVHARLVVGEMERSREKLALMARGAKSSLAIGTSPPAATSLIPEAVHQFRKMHPDVHLAIHENTINFLLPQLRAGKLDFLVVRLDQPKVDGNIRYDLLYQEEIRIVVGHKHALANKRKLDWADVVNVAWIGPASESPLRRELELELALAGQTAPSYQIETTSTLVQVGLLQDGSLAAAMSARMAEYFCAAGQVSILPLRYQRRSGIGVLSLRGTSPTTYKEAFLNALKSST